MGENRFLKMASPQDSSLSSGNPETIASPEALAVKIAQAFLKITYPLSDEGKLLRDKVKSNIEKKDKLEPILQELPTVENPRSELFADLENPEVLQQICTDLGNLQVSKGCRHKCTFCAAGAAAKVEMMPFAAIVKFAAYLRSREQNLLVGFDEWKRFVKERTGIDLDDFDYQKRGISAYRALTPEKGLELKQLYDEEYSKFAIAKIVPIPSRPINYDYPQNSKEINDFNFFCRYYPFSLSAYPIRKQMTNYYDSDPFDYRDSSFLHSDGTTSDYGDVVEILASTTHPIHITTAGWRLGDKTSQRAAEKISRLKDRILRDPRISVNPYELQAQQNLDSYRDSILNVLHTLSSIKPQILAFFKSENPSPEDTAFVNSVIVPIKNKARQMGLEYIEPIISLYSGPMADPLAEEDDHHDVMACMYGYHIWPDGTVSFQKHDPESITGVPKGSRPTPIDKKLW